jgi:molybdopterin molybdotransferase
MISVSDAQALVLLNTQPLAAETHPLASSLLGVVLAEDVVSDLEMPPYDKSLMDGFAVRSSDLPDGKGILAIIEEITAGQVPQHPLGSEQAARIMTGAKIPVGADAVVVVERTKAREGNRIEIEDRPPKPGQNILYQGREMKVGETILRAGMVLRPQELGLLATMGKTLVKIQPAPNAGILATGDELVEPSQRPGPGQIRNGNSLQLMGQVSRAGGNPRCLGIGRDNSTSLRSLVAEGLQSNMLLLSGGVSAGKLDLVPGILEELGVRPHFHKVDMKPGKPVFFGTKGATIVFGLPGNPVSVLACFELFVRPAIRRLRGHADVGPRMVQAVLAKDYRYQSDRPTYHPARLEAGARGWQVCMVPWFGSSDLRALAQANALAVLAKGDHCHRAGQELPVLCMED